MYNQLYRCVSLEVRFVKRGRFARSDLASICKINVAISKFSRSRIASMKRYRSEVTGIWTGVLYADDST